MNQKKCCFPLLVCLPLLVAYSGFGIAVQAYQQRAIFVLEWLDKKLISLNKKMNVRLVKGAYWDTEIKLAQEKGLDNYPVFTKKFI